MRNLALLVIVLLASCGSGNASNARNVQQITNATAAIDATLDGADKEKALPAAKASLAAAVYQHGYLMDPITSTVTDAKGNEVAPIHTAAAIVANTDATTADIVGSAEKAVEAKDAEGGGWKAWGIGILSILASMKVLSNVPIVGSLLEKATEWFVATKSTKESRQKADKSVQILNQVVRGVEEVHEILPESNGLGKLRTVLDKITDSDFNAIVQEITTTMTEEKIKRGEKLL